MILPLLLAVALTSQTSIYHRLDPYSVPQQLAYHELYPDTPEGEQALARAWEILGGESTSLPFEALSPQHMVDMLQGVESGKRLDEASLAAVEKLGQRLQHHHLAGHKVWTQEEVLALPETQVDVARGLLITLFGEDRELIRSYEAILDLMALQILGRTTLYAKPAQKIAVINWFLFDEMHMRFPPTPPGPPTSTNTPSSPPSSTPAAASASASPPSTSASPSGLTSTSKPSPLQATSTSAPSTAPTPSTSKPPPVASTSPPTTTSASTPAPSKPAPTAK